MQATKGRAGEHHQYKEQGRAMQARLLFHNDAPKTITPIYYGDYEVVRYWDPVAIPSGTYTEVIDFQYKVEDYLCVVIADSNCVGVTAMQLMAQFQALIHAFASDGPSPAALLEKVNDLLHESVAADIEVNAFVCMMNLRDRDLVYANAGHPCPVWFHDEHMQVLDEQGPPLAKHAETTYEETTIHLGDGDRVLMYSEGLYARVNGDREPFGQERLFELFQKHRDKTAIPAEQAIADDLESFSSVIYDHDITLMIVDFNV